MVSSIKKYMKNRIPDYLICVGAALGLSFNIFSSFVMTDHLSTSIPITLAVIVITVMLAFIAAYNKRNTIIFIGLFIIIAIISVIYFHKNNPFVGEGYDQSVNLFWIITILSSVIVFLISRTKAGCIVLFAAGNVVIAAFAFLEYPVVIWGYFIFLFCAIMAYFNRVYYTAAIKAHCGKVSFKANFIQTAAMCIVVLVISTGIFQFIIKPLDLPTENLKLYTKLMSMEILEKVGVSSTIKRPDYEKLSNQEQEEEEYANNRENQEETDPVQEDYDSADASSPNSEGVDKNKTGEGETEDAQKITYDILQYINFTIIIIICICIIILLVLPFVLKRLLRERWYKRVMIMDSENGSMAVYSDILRKLRIAGHKKLNFLTLLEFAQNNEKHFEGFTVSEITFKKLTETYVSILYGNTQINSREFDNFILFHRCLNKNIKKDIGSIKYAIKYFII